VIVYFDTSAFVPLLINEPATGVCQRLWNDADSVVTTRMLFVETAAALAQAYRLGRLTRDQHRRSLVLLDRLWSELDIVEVYEDLVRRAASLANDFGLRVYDAVHCASAEQVDDEELVAAAGDHALLDAWLSLGLAVSDINQHPPEPGE
jgi:predicted nucleic acid-binding protein